jgi:hypothetical protein
VFPRYIASICSSIFWPYNKEGGVITNVAFLCGEKSREKEIDLFIVQYYDHMNIYTNTMNKPTCGFHDFKFDLKN